MLQGINMNNKEYNVIVKGSVIQEFFGKYSPFNLNKDIKAQELKEKDLNNIAIELADMIKGGYMRPTCTAFNWNSAHTINLTKVRIEDVTRQKGKSNGYRCIVLVDELNNYIYLLHIYRHSHGEKENISKSEENELKYLLKVYEESICAV